MKQIYASSICPCLYTRNKYRKEVIGFLFSLSDGAEADEIVLKKRRCKSRQAVQPPAHASGPKQAQETKLPYRTARH